MRFCTFLHVFKRFCNALRILCIFLCTRGALGLLWATLRALLRVFCMVLCDFPCFSPLGALLSASGTLSDTLGRSWDALGATLRRSWELLDALGALWERPWETLESMLGLSCEKPRKNHEILSQLGMQNGSQNDQKSMLKAKTFSGTFF